MMVSQIRPALLASAALLWVACDLSHLQDGEERAGAGGNGAGGDGAGGDGGNLTCAPESPFLWLKAVGNEQQQVTGDPLHMTPLSSIRVGAIPSDQGGGFLAVLMTDGPLTIDGTPLGGAGSSLFVLRFSAEGSLEHGVAHPQPGPAEPEDFTRHAIDDVIVRSDGTAVVAGRLAEAALVLQSDAGPNEYVQSIPGTDGFIATFDVMTGLGIAAVRVESTNDETPATVAGLAELGGELIAVGSFVEQVQVGGQLCAPFPSSGLGKPHGFVLVLDDALGCSRGRAFPATKGAKIELTAVAATGDRIAVAGSFDLREGNKGFRSLLLNDAPEWRLEASDGKPYNNEGLVIALDGALAPQWVTVVESGDGKVKDQPTTIAIDEETGSIWLGGWNTNDGNLGVTTTSARRTHAISGPALGPSCTRAFAATESRRALVSALAPDGGCLGIDVHSGDSFVNASAAGPGGTWMGGQGMVSALGIESLDDYAADGLPSGLLLRTSEPVDGSVGYGGVVFGGERTVRVDDVAVVGEGLVVAGSMGMEFLDLACSGTTDEFDFFLARISP